MTTKAKPLGNHRPNDPLGTWAEFHRDDACDDCAARSKAKSFRVKAKPRVGVFETQSGHVWLSPESSTRDVHALRIDPVVVLGAPLARPPCLLDVSITFGGPIVVTFDDSLVTCKRCKNVMEKEPK